jgi:phosphoglucomutase
MTVRTVPIQPFDDQRPGTSGLRKATRTFQQPGYLEAYVQAVFNAQPIEGELVLGGDGRYFNVEALQTIIRIAAGNGVQRLIVGRDGLLSTPAASHLIRSRRTAGGLILSASHNPGGPNGDFGVKFNGPNGAPAAESVSEAIYAATKGVTAYRIADLPPFDLSRLGRQQAGDVEVEVVDPAADYADLMERLFDFDRLRGLIGRPGFRMAFDSMHAITGPYATEIFERRLGAAAGTVIRGEVLPDFGGGHPDPNPAHATALVELMDGASPPAFGAASDGDGDRHLIVGPKFVVSPSDSLAVLAANAELVPGYRGRVTGVARSMPTSRALDVVAHALGVPCYETPTGWKYFGSLLDAGKITLCGEESAGAGSDHVREKDGVWAVLFWLSILAERELSVEGVVREHWARFGRHAYVRLDFEGVDSDRAAGLMSALRERAPGLAGGSVRDRRVLSADDFSYTDPVNGEVSQRQGVRVELEGGGRVVYRLSGTGTSGATLRVYLEQVCDGAASADRSPGELTADVERIAAEIADLPRFGLQEPTHRV